MPAYVIIQGRVHDPGKYEVYKKLTPASIQKYGGRFIVRGGAAEDLEGRWDTGRVVVIEFPTVARAKEWYDSPEYSAARAVRKGSADMIFTVVEGV